MRAISWVTAPVCSPTSAWRVCSSITISSSDALPARSPIPLIAHSTCRAPACRPANELATASPRSSWQWTDSTTSRSSGTSSYSRVRYAAYSCGIAYPTVSGMLIVVAPSSIAI